MASLLLALLMTLPASAAEEEVTLPRGLMLTLTSAAKTEGSAAHTKDTQLARLVALHIPKGHRGSPFLPQPAFHARFEGFINVGLRGRYTFSAEGRGNFTLTINGNKVLESGDETDLARLAPAEKIRLNKGGNAIVVEYEWKPGDEASLRLYWQSDEFPREPVPAAAFTHDPKNEFLAHGLELREGRELFATMRCVKCHDPGNALLDAAALMPELNLDAPSLTDAGTRLKENWMAAWISNPRSLRPDASMPRLHTMPGHGPGGGGAGMVPMWAADIAAFLATQGKPAAAPPASDTESIKAGGNLFATLGCVGCHTRPDHKDDASIDGRVPLKYVGAKWQPTALRAFLLKPDRHYAWIRMPDFRLSDAEADQLAAFILSFPAADVPDRGGRGRAPSAEHGKQMFQMHGCVACHDKGASDAGLVNHFNSPSLEDLKKADWKKGCLTDNAASLGRAPDFGFTRNQRDALRTFAAGALGWRSLDRDTPTEFAARQLRLAQCTACHKRDGDNDRWSNHESEVASLIIKPKVEEKPKPADDFDDEDPTKPKEAQIDQSRPELTHIGEKLKPQWMEQFIAGKLDYKLRPWLTARMPAFPARAHWLAQGFAMEHGFSPDSPAAVKDPEPDLEMAAIGKQLVGRSIDGKAGFACVQCHAIGKKPAENVFEAQGINFAYAKERLRHEYYMRWMLKPARVQPGTRMPAFALEDGTTPFTEVLGGDARKQFDAIWQYLLLGREITPP